MAQHSADATPSMQLLTSGFYVNPGSFMAIGIIFPVLGLLMVSSRFYARVRNRLEIGADDWLCIPAWVLLSATGAVYIYAGAEHVIGTRLPPGLTFEQLLADPSFDYKKYLKVEWYSNIFCTVSAGLIRLSFLFFYRRIFRGRTFDITNWVLIGLVSAWTIAMSIATFTVGHGFAVIIWKSHTTTPSGFHDALIFLGILPITGFVLDLFIMGVPFPWIWRLQMRNIQKLGVSSVFLCGLFVVAAGAIRMVNGIDAMIWKNGDYENVFGLKARGDLLGWPCVWLFWSYIENGTGMVVCCLPSMKLLFKKAPALKTTRRVPSLFSIKPFIQRKARASPADSDYMERALHQEKKPSHIEVARTVDICSVPGSVDTIDSSTQSLC